MTRRKGKSVSFDAMVKFFMQNYNIPTKSDFDQILERLDRIETLVVKASEGAGRGKGGGSRAKSVRAAAREITEGSAADLVLKVVERHATGAGLKEVQASTGFDEKKIRNLFYRLNKMNKIERRGRGVYTVV